MSETTKTTAPDYIAADDYSGKWQITRTVQSLAQRGQMVGWDRAADLAVQATDGVLTIWEFSGHLRDGRKLFHRTRFVPAADGSLHGYDSSGRKVIVHPADRIVRYLGRA